MSSGSPITKQAGISKIYASSFIHATLWAFVTAKRQEGKSVSEGILDFIQLIGCEDLEIKSLQKTYERMNSDYKECFKGIAEDAKDIFRTEPEKYYILKEVVK